jgi:uncharacterized membrane protein (DUF4010 family)
VTLSLSRRSREPECRGALTAALAAGILLAWTVMFARVAIEVAAVHPALLPPLVPPLAAPAVIAAIAAFAAYRSAGHARSDTTSEVPLRNPFSLMAAIRFALLFAVVLLVVKIVETHAPGRGLYAVAALAGLTDVDAITLSMATSARDGATEAHVAVNAIVIAALTNSVVKLGLVFAVGAPLLKSRLTIATAGMLCAAALALLVG